jgi:dipeptidyl aminopeptidase/acylaminoacyl peptidase
MLASALWISLLAATAPAAAAAPTPPAADGTLLEKTACPPNPLHTYEEYVEIRRRRLASEVAAAKEEGFEVAMPTDLTPMLISREDFATRLAYAGFECWHIRYASDGLAVTGYLWKPRDTAGKKLPLMVYLRGGNRDFGAVAPWMYSGFHQYLANGFVVMAPQYRGVDGGEGQEEFGGAEVRDVLNLLPLARSLPYVDTNNVFLHGWSRGGMEALVALKAGFAANAVAVGGPAVDFDQEIAKRPAMETVLSALIPGYADHPLESRHERSALLWPEKINAPLLLLHGGADWRVDPAQTLALAQKLQTLGKPYELIIYGGDDHGLSRNSEDADRRIIAWFKKYMR